MTNCFQQSQKSKVPRSLDGPLQLVGILEITLDCFTVKEQTVLSTTRDQRDAQRRHSQSAYPISR